MIDEATFYVIFGRRVYPMSRGVEDFYACECFSSFDKGYVFTVKLH